MNTLPPFKTLDEIFISYGVDPKTLTEDERTELTYLLENMKKTWAHKKLVNKYGFVCDSQWDSCNGFSSAEIAAERKAANE